MPDPFDDERTTEVAPGSYASMRQAGIVGGQRPERIGSRGDGQTSGTRMDPGIAGRLVHERAMQQPAMSEVVGRLRQVLEFGQANTKRLQEINRRVGGPVMEGKTAGPLTGPGFPPDTLLGILSGLADELGASADELQAEIVSLERRI